MINTSAVLQQIRPAPPSHNPRLNMPTVVPSRMKGAPLTHANRLRHLSPGNLTGNGGQLKFGPNDKPKVVSSFVVRHASSATKTKTLCDRIAALSPEELVSRMPEVRKEIKALDENGHRDVLISFTNAYFKSTVLASDAQSKSIVKFIFDESARLPADHRAWLYAKLCSPPHTSIVKASPLIRRILDAIPALTDVHQKHLYKLLSRNLAAVPKDLRITVAQNISQAFAQDLATRATLLQSMTSVLPKLQTRQSIALFNFIRQESTVFPDRIVQRDILLSLRAQTRQARNESHDQTEKSRFLAALKSLSLPLQELSSPREAEIQTALLRQVTQLPNLRCGQISDWATSLIRCSQDLASDPRAVLVLKTAQNAAQKNSIVTSMGPARIRQLKIAAQRLFEARQSI